MDHPKQVRTTFFRLLAGAAVGLGLAACGGGEADPAPTAKILRARASATPPAAPSNVTGTLLAGITIQGYPHKVDVYRPAQATRAMVILHGQGGRNWQVAYELRLNKVSKPSASANVDWEWLNRNGVIAVFPQGQSKPGSAIATWSNHLFDSGQNDVAFLAALAAHVRANYGVSEVSLLGHSSGGVMTSRVWCEATTAYDKYVSLAGPMVQPDSQVAGGGCIPLTPAPYEIVVGGKDSKIALFDPGVMVPTPEQKSAGLTTGPLLSEWYRHRNRAVASCAEVADVQANGSAAGGPVWSQCAARVRYTLVTNADHPISSIEAFSGQRMIDRTLAFAR